MVKFIDIVPHMEQVLSTHTSTTTPMHCDQVRSMIATAMGVDPSSMGLTASKPQKPVWSMLCGHAFNELKTRGLVESKFKGHAGAEWWWIGASAVATPIVATPTLDPTPIIDPTPIATTPIATPIVEKATSIIPMTFANPTPTLDPTPRVIPMTFANPTPIVDPTPIVEPIPETTTPNPLDLLLARAKAENPDFSGFYDYTDPLIKSVLISSSECFGTYSAKDTECGLCPLASDCQSKKASLDKAKADKKAYQVANKDTIEQEKAKATLLKALPSGVNLSSAKYQPAVLKDCICALSKTTIQSGQPCFFVVGLGIISKDAGLTLGLSV